MRYPPRLYIFVLALFGGVFMLVAPVAKAAGFDPNLLISDAEFIDSNTMTEDQIQDFLVSQGSGLATVDPSRLGSAERAARIIYVEAHNNNINPAVLLTTLQKEESLLSITNNNQDGYQSRLDHAMGYGCPDNGGCSQSYLGFANQVENAAWHFSFNYRRAQGTGYSDYQVGQTVNITSTDHPDMLVTFSNRATAALYRYTPHVYYGNYNFYTLYQRYLPYFNALSFFQNGQLLAGDWDGDSKAEAGIFYNYGQALAALWRFKPEGAAFTSSVAYSTGTGNWDASRNGNLISGDFNGDGKQDFATMYDYSRNTTSIWVFVGDGNGGFAPSVWYASGAGNWSRLQSSSLAAGDFNGDGKTDLGVLYDYGNANTGVWSFLSNGSSFNPERWYLSGSGNWNMSQTAGLTAGDFNADGKADLATLYDYGGAMTNAWVFQSNGSSFAPSVWYASGAGNWNASQTSNLTAADFNGDGKADLATMYSYGNRRTNLWVFAAGNSFTPSVWYQSNH